MSESATAVGNREKLLRGAVRCLRDKGYANTTARDLVAASGANLASIGYHFGGKEALLNEAVAETMRAWTRSIEERVSAASSTDATEQLAATFSSTVDHFDELEPYLRSFVESFPPALRSEELRVTMAAAYEEVRVAGESMLERLFENAHHPADPDQVRALSSMLIALCDGLILQWLLDPQAVPESTVMIDALSSVATVLAAREPERGGAK